MTINPFFPRFNAKFTMTPNAFFDRVLTEASSLNEVRVIGYVIRKTIGWNKKYECIARSQFVTEAKISNGQLTKTLQSCLNKRWLLCFRTGEPGKEESFYFLNDALNAKLVAGLEQNLFSIGDVQYKSEEGLIHLLKSNGIEYYPDAEEANDRPEKEDHEEVLQLNGEIHNPPEAVAVPSETGQPNPVVNEERAHEKEEVPVPEAVCQKEGYGFRRGTESVGVRTPEGYGNRRGTESVEVGVRNPYGYPYGIRRGRGTESVGVNGPQAQAPQGSPDPLNTDLKYNILNTKDQIQQQHQRSVTEDLKGSRSRKPDDDVDVVVPVSKYRSQNHEVLEAEIFKTAQELQLPMNDYCVEQLINAGEADLDRIIAAMHAAKQFASNKKVENWCGLLIYAVRHGHQPGPEDPASLALKAKEDKYKDVYQ